jgi:hypothetical protein
MRLGAWSAPCLCHSLRPHIPNTRPPCSSAPLPPSPLSPSTPNHFIGPRRPPRLLAPPLFLSIPYADERLDSTRRYEHPPNSHCPTDDTIWRAGMCSCDQGRTHGGSRFFWLAGPVSFFGLSVLFLLGGWADEGEDETIRWDECETLACGATPPRHRALFSVGERSAAGSLRVLVSLRGMRGPRQR